MPNVTEDKVKSLLRERGIPVPAGGAAATPAEARAVAARIGKPVVVKALVATGRRGKSGAVRFADDPEEAGRAAEAILGTVVNGHLCSEVYLEEKVAIERELYLAFYLEDFPPRILISAEGGVDIESVHRDRPEAVIAVEIDPLRGVPAWDAVELWEQAGIDGRVLAGLGRLTADLYRQFRDADATMLELNPVAITADGPVVVGAMMTVEDPLLEESGGSDVASGGRPLNERELRVIEANARIPGGMVRYTELDGDIGLWVGGGGAGLVQHDMILAAGGRPANHTDASTVNPDKVRVLVDAILDNPNVRSLFVSWHYQQMARIEKRVVPVVEALKARNIDPRRFPVVIRMFGPGEELAREAAAELDGIHYLPHGAPLSDGVRLIVDLTNEFAAEERAQ